MNRPHRIRRQRLQVTAADPVQAFALREMLRLAWESALLPAMNHAFDGVACGDEVVRLPRLEIRLDFPSLAACEQDFPALLRERLLSALARAMPGAVAEVPEARPAPGRHPDDSADALFHYLTTGNQPWYDARRDAAEVVAGWRQAIAVWKPATALAELATAVPPDIRAARAFAGRFLQLVGPAAQDAWLDEAVRAADWPPGAPARRLRQLLATAGGLRADETHRLAAVVLALALRRLRHLADPEAAWWRVELAPELPAAWRPDVLAAAGGPPDTTAPGPDQARPAGLAGGDGGGPGEAGPRGQETTATGSGTATAPRALGSAHGPGSMGDIAGPVGADTESLLVANAGLVLLHPFLVPCFESLGLVAAGSPQLAPTHLPRAAALLAWLASGRDEAYEFELGAIKVLLGLAPDDPLPLAPGLIGDAEREEGMALLAAALTHWSALKNTRVDGLRVAFLQRPGLLSVRGDGWLLRPEPESYDLLLGQLPWAIGIVKLPWMTRPLFTEWPTA